jgi:hypothetical protein
VTFIPVPDADGSLWRGDKIDLRNPPKHCNSAMRIDRDRGGFRLVCHTDDYVIHTDDQGVLTEPPYITKIGGAPLG